MIWSVLILFLLELMIWSMLIYSLIRDHLKGWRQTPTWSTHGAERENSIVGEAFSGQVIRLTFVQTGQFFWVCWQVHHRYLHCKKEKNVQKLIYRCNKLVLVASIIPGTWFFSTTTVRRTDPCSSQVPLFYVRERTMQQQEHRSWPPSWNLFHIRKIQDSWEIWYINLCVLWHIGEVISVLTHSKKVWPGSFLCAVCMFSQCLCG